MRHWREKYDNKMVVNQTSGFAKLSLNRIKGMIAVLKNLTPKTSEQEKVWFIEIDKIFQEKNLKIFYLPMASLHKLLVNQNFGKLPDPLHYFVGLTFIPEIQKPRETKKIDAKVQIKENPLKQPRTSFM